MARIRRVNEPGATGDAPAAHAEWFAANPGRAEILDISTGGPSRRIP